MGPKSVQILKKENGYIEKKAIKRKIETEPTSSPIGPKFARIGPNSPSFGPKIIQIDISENDNYDTQGKQSLNSEQESSAIGPKSVRFGPKSANFGANQLTKIDLLFDDYKKKDVS